MQDSLPDLVVKLSSPLTNPFTPASRLFWLYLAGALVLAFFVYRARRAEGALAGNPAERHRFIGFCFPKAVFAHRSALIDYRYYVVHNLVRVFGLVPVLVGAPFVADATAGLLERLAGPVGDPLPNGPVARLCYTTAILVALDFGLFVAHYLSHRVPLLWEFHKVHHSAQVLTPITLYRMHPVDDMLSGASVAVATGAVVGVFSWGFDGPISEVLVNGTNLGLFVFYLLGYNLRHSHIWLAYPRWLSWALVSPAQHQVHHSSAPVHFNRNMGFVFSFWDRLAGTLYVPARRESLHFGLGDGQDEEFDSVSALYFLPFRKAAKLLLSAYAKNRRSAPTRTRS